MRDPCIEAHLFGAPIVRLVDNELSHMVLSGPLDPGDRVIVGEEEERLTFEVVDGLPPLRPVSNEDGCRPSQTRQPQSGSG